VTANKLPQESELEIITPEEAVLLFPNLEKNGKRSMHALLGYGVHTAVFRRILGLVDNTLWIITTDLDDHLVLGASTFQHLFPLVTGSEVTQVFD
jgi:hypothetical protein